MNDLVDTKTAAKIIGYSPSYLRKWRMQDNKRLPFYRIGRGIRYSVKELEAYVESCRVAA